MHKITWSEMMAAVFIQSAKKANTLIHKKNSALIVMILANPVRQMVQSVKHALKDFHLVIQFVFHVETDKRLMAIYVQIAALDA